MNEHWRTLNKEREWKRERDRDRVVSLFGMA